MAVREKPILEGALEVGEVLIDQLVENPIAKEIPVVGSTLKLIKGVNDIRNRVFAAKIQSFIDPMNQADESFREEWKRKKSNNPEECEKIGETLLLVIEKTNDLKKAKLFGILFISFVYESITATDLSRLVQAVDMCFIDDVISLIKAEEAPMRSQETWMRYLQNGSFTTLVLQYIGDIQEAQNFSTTALGELLRKAHLEGQQRTKTRLFSNKE